MSKLITTIFCFLISTTCLADWVVEYSLMLPGQKSEGADTIDSLIFGKELLRAQNEKMSNDRIYNANHPNDGKR